MILSDSTYNKKLPPLLGIDPKHCIMWGCDRSLYTSSGLLTGRRGMCQKCYRQALREGDLVPQWTRMPSPAPACADCDAPAVWRYRMASKHPVFVCRAHYDRRRMSDPPTRKDRLARKAAQERVARARRKAVRKEQLTKESHELAA